MVDALDIKALKRKLSKYDYDEQRIVGIILARYDLPFVQAIVDSCYLYWHHNTGRHLDIFWAGYGEYLCPNEETATKIILKFPNNKTRIYYDTLAFISIKNEFNQIFKNNYLDQMQLILVNYHNGKLNFEESMKIDLEENLDTNFATIRTLIEFITNECRSISSVTDLARKLNAMHIKDYLKKQIKGITLSDIIKAAIKI